MCYPVQCPNCGKTGWGGCGQHVDAVMSSVPVAERCSCRGVPPNEDNAGRRRVLFRSGSRPSGRG